MPLTQPTVDWLYDALIPVAFSALLAATLLLVREVVLKLEAARGQIARAVGVQRKLPKYGRKGLLVTGASTIFAFSCAYRAYNVADEGAFLCRGPSTRFNAPWAGRLVATMGELALAVQLSAYLEDSAMRLGVQRVRTFAAKQRTLPLALVAECLSWMGVLTAIPTFFCYEYACWMAIGCMWAWDSAELLHRSTSRGDSVVHALVIALSLGLVLFNALHEMPHFFGYSNTSSPLIAAQVANVSQACALRGNAFVCVQDATSPLWQKRLPFFVSYFAGCSWLSTSLGLRYALHGAQPSSETVRKR